MCVSLGYLTFCAANMMLFVIWMSDNRAILEGQDRLVTLVVRGCPDTGYVHIKIVQIIQYWQFIGFNCLCFIM